MAVEMAKKASGFPEEMQDAWEEAMFCAKLIREGRARIVIRTLADGRRRRYTKIIL